MDVAVVSLAAGRLAERICLLMLAIFQALEWIAYLRQTEMCTRVPLASTTDWRSPGELVACHLPWGNGEVEGWRCEKSRSVMVITSWKRPESHAGTHNIMERLARSAPRGQLVVRQAVIYVAELCKS